MSTSENSALKINPKCIKFLTEPGFQKAREKLFSLLPCTTDTEWSQALDAMYFEPDAPLLGYKGYSGVERVRSFKDFIKRLTEENEKLPLEYQYDVLRDEAATIARYLEQKAEKRKSEIGSLMPPLGTLRPDGTPIDPLLEPLRTDGITAIPLDGVTKSDTVEFPLDLGAQDPNRRDSKRHRGLPIAAASSTAAALIRNGLSDTSRIEFKSAWALLGDALIKILETTSAKSIATTHLPATINTVTPCPFEEQKKKIERIKSVITMFESEGESTAEHVTQLKEKLKSAEAEFVQMVLKM